MSDDPIDTRCPERWIRDRVWGPTVQHVLADHPEWSMPDPEAPWDWVRSDGLRAGHKIEMATSTWRETVEVSIRLADKYVPLGADLPDHMRTREDPYYGHLEEIDRFDEFEGADA